MAGIRSACTMTRRDHFRPDHSRKLYCHPLLCLGATSGGVLAGALITSAATAKRIQSTMKLGTAYLDVDFALPPRINMKFVNSKVNEKDDLPRDTDELEIACK
jgi:hypothetical protein